jgi:hypothetical protein
VCLYCSTPASQPVVSFSCNSKDQMLQESSSELATLVFHRTLAAACAFWDLFSERAEGQESWRKYIRISKFERIVAWKEITLKGWNGKMHEEIEASQSSEFLLWETARFEDLTKRVSNKIPLSKRCQSQEELEKLKKKTTEAQLQRGLLT